MSRLISDRHLKTDDGLDFFYGHHLDGIPRATIQESAIRAFAGAFLAADAKHGIDLDVAEWRMILVGNPVHAIGNRAIWHASGRPRTPCTTLGDDGQLLGPFLPGCGDAL